MSSQFIEFNQTVPVSDSETKQTTVLIHISNIASAVYSDKQLTIHLSQPTNGGRSTITLEGQAAWDTLQALRQHT